MGRLPGKVFAGADANFDPELLRNFAKHVCEINRTVFSGHTGNLRENIGHHTGKFWLQRAARQASPKVQDAVTCLVIFAPVGLKFGR